MPTAIDAMAAKRSINGSFLDFLVDREEAPPRIISLLAGCTTNGVGGTEDVDWLVKPPPPEVLAAYWGGIRKDSTLLIVIRFHAYDYTWIWDFLEESFYFF